MLHCNVHVSWRTQAFSLIAHGIVMLAILLVPLPLRFWPLSIIFLVIVMFECINSQRRIARIAGSLNMRDSGGINWQGEMYRITRSPFVLRNGVLLRLIHVDSGKSRLLWLAIDSMPRDIWRAFCGMLTQQQTLTTK